MRSVSSGLAGSCAADRPGSRQIVVRDLVRPGRPGHGDGAGLHSQEGNRPLEHFRYSLLGLARRCHRQRRWGRSIRQDQTGMNRKIWYQGSVGQGAGSVGGRRRHDEGSRQGPDQVGMAATVGTVSAAGRAWRTTTGAAPGGRSGRRLCPLGHDAPAEEQRAWTSSRCMPRRRRSTPPRRRRPRPTAASIEHQLNVLDQLAAKGYITQSEYQARRQALLNQL